MPKGSPSSYVGDYRPISITLLLSKVFENIVVAKWSPFLESNSSLLPPFQFSYHRRLGKCDALLTLSHHLLVTLDRGTEGLLVQFYFSAAFDRVSHSGLLYKLRSAGCEQFLSIVSEFLSDSRKRVRAFAW